ncbi:hypothetical protein BJ165DRAFT_1352579, partial [Panaeolus papilionaceus]
MQDESLHKIPLSKKQKTTHCVLSYDEFNKNQESAACNTAEFPPSPLSLLEQERIINDFCNELLPVNIEEAGCRVCGQITLIKNMIDISDRDLDMSCLISPYFTRKERLSESDPIEGLTIPAIVNECNHICIECYKCVCNNKMPKNALANGLWIGSVPEVLQNLTFAEKMMISKIRHNRCLVTVASGRSKLRANVIMFENPIGKVYNMLPPSRAELDEIIAFLFVGSAQPTDEELKRTPMLVRRNVVYNALTWLKLNHKDYAELSISMENLNSYPLSGIPVKVDFRQCKTDTDPTDKEHAEMSTHEAEINIGVDKDSECPLTVKGITGVDYVKMSPQSMKITALHHLRTGGKMLTIGHASEPTSTYNNMQLYPQMFPWLFPYGYGGIGQDHLIGKISELEHKRRLLMYWDKRFQLDRHFPMIAFNHHQIKSNVNGSFIFAKPTLQSIVDRLNNNENVQPETNEEKECFKMLDNIN